MLIEAVIRGELMEMELTPQDFCPECCGSLVLEGNARRQQLRCTSCQMIFRPKPAEGSAAVQGNA